MKCRRCKTAESTGVTIALCDACFDAFEQETKRDDTGTGLAIPTEGELEYINKPWIRRMN